MDTGRLACLCQHGRQAGSTLFGVAVMLALAAGILAGILAARILGAGG